jgi:hypothetical protein
MLSSNSTVHQMNEAGVNAAVNETLQTPRSAQEAYEHAQTAFQSELFKLDNAMGRLQQLTQSIDRSVSQLSTPTSGSPRSSSEGGAPEPPRDTLEDIVNNCEDVNDLFEKRPPHSFELKEIYMELLRLKLVFEQETEQLTGMFKSKRPTDMDAIMHADMEQLELMLIKVTAERDKLAAEKDRLIAENDKVTQERDHAVKQNLRLNEENKKLFAMLRQQPVKGSCPAGGVSPDSSSTIPDDFEETTGSSDHERSSESSKPDSSQPSSCQAYAGDRSPTELGSADEIIRPVVVVSEDGKGSQQSSFRWVW